jgi:hypothetical protein
VNKTFVWYPFGVIQKNEIYKEINMYIPAKVAGAKKAKSGHKGEGRVYPIIAKIIFACSSTRFFDNDRVKSACIPVCCWSEFKIPPLPVVRNFIQQRDSRFQTQESTP